MKRLAPVIGFFEVLIWLLAIGQIMQNLSNVFCYIAYAGGFAAGTYFGISLERKISLGIVIIRVITRKDATELVTRLNESDFGVTSIDAQGAKGKVNIIFTIVKRRDLENVVSLIKAYNPNAFFSVEDVRSVSEGIFPLPLTAYRKNITALRLGLRKGK
jgi:uncharacterized protein YebE (UPF0316 family)